VSQPAPRVPGRYGRRAPDPSRPALRLAPFLTGVVPAHPAFADYLARLTNWLMLGNAEYGDCVVVTWANTRRLVTAVLSTENYPTLAQVYTLYETQNPGFPQQDNGMDIQTCLQYLVSHGGPDGVKAAGFAKVDYTNPAEVQAAIAIFGSVWIGINVQQAQENQFNAGQPWDWVPGAAVIGGHSVITGGYGPAGTRTPRADPAVHPLEELAATGTLSGDEDFITWAQETSFTDNFWANGVEEAWVVIWPEHLGSKEFLAGVDLTAFAADYTAITGQPFPVAVPPAPTPAPVPVPPGPDANPADVALAHSATAWAFRSHIMAADKAVAGAVRAWLAAKGFVTQ